MRDPKTASAPATEAGREASLAALAPCFGRALEVLDPEPSADAAVAELSAMSGMHVGAAPAMWSTRAATPAGVGVGVSSPGDGRRHTAKGSSCEPKKTPSKTRTVVTPIVRPKKSACAERCRWNLVGMRVNIVCFRFILFCLGRSERRRAVMHKGDRGDRGLGREGSLPPLLPSHLPHPTRTQ